MNDLAAEGFKDAGGINLIINSAILWHTEPTRFKVKKSMRLPHQTSISLKKNGKREMVYHAPYYVEGQFAGYIELCL